MDYSEHMRITHSVSTAAEDLKVLDNVGAKKIIQDFKLLEGTTLVYCVVAPYDWNRFVSTVTSAPIQDEFMTEGGILVKKVRSTRDVTGRCIVGSYYEPPELYESILRRLKSRFSVKGH